MNKAVGYQHRSSFFVLWRTYFPYVLVVVVYHRHLVTVHVVFVSLTHFWNNTISIEFLQGRLFIPRRIVAVDGCCSKLLLPNGEYDWCLTGPYKWHHSTLLCIAYLVLKCIKHIFKNLFSLASSFVQTRLKCGNRKHALVSDAGCTKMNSHQRRRLPLQSLCLSSPFHDYPS